MATFNSALAGKAIAAGRYVVMQNTDKESGDITSGLSEEELTELVSAAIRDFDLSEPAERGQAAKEAWNAKRANDKAVARLEAGEDLSQEELLALLRGE
ncbi:MAG: hypothetical protein ACREQV_20495 [Candidatus Binatia bacterium]